MNSNHTIIKMLLDRWNSSLKSSDTLLSTLSAEQLAKEIAPNKNRGTYLLGHLIAVHDDMLVLLGLGDKLFPEMHHTYIASPDKAVEQTLSAQELRARWSKQNEVLKQKFESVKPEEWFAKHTAVSDEDFSKEPHRNKLNIILTRTTHLNYHTGQLVLLK